MHNGTAQTNVSTSAKEGLQQQDWFRYVKKEPPLWILSDKLEGHHSEAMVLSVMCPSFRFRVILAKAQEEVAWPAL